MMIVLQNQRGGEERRKHLLITVLLKMNQKERDHLFEQTVEARNSFWEEVGTVDPNVMTHFINPAFMGGPRWPALRQAFIKVETPDSVILTSDGLSDPFDDREEPSQGFGVECYLESTDPALRTSIASLNQTWQFVLVYQVAQNFAQNGNVKALFKEYGILSMEFYDLGVPDAFCAEDGRVGVMLGVKPWQRPLSIAGPVADIDLISIKLLAPRELEHILQYGGRGREALAKMFHEQGSYHLSNLGRVSVV